MKKFMTVLITAIALLSIVACGNKSNDKKEVASVDTILSEIKEQIASDYKESGVEEEVLVDNKLQGFVEADLIKKTDDPANNIYIEKLKLNKDDIEAGIVLAPMMNTKSDEIIILKAKDEKQVKELKKILEKEKEAQIAQWERYLPDQYEKVKNNIIKTNGKYLLYVTYDDPSKIESIFDKHTK
ncbi:DUF4358 domain-containing protein [Bacillus massiliigorillae]|uniref:DUF4358 domain-containing protein n=1 Tax=Bacillus massiliigorillae TaxID=1243664 RepID=UPI0003A74400|nr:DUF4358 domain-containing protein [Bacillus massiliigorillae]